MAASSRGASPTRPADVRPVSSTSRTCRSRSGRQVRTMTSDARAEARQSMDRTSSPTTYSRSESNSLPWPRIITSVRPSSSRSRASLAGRCLRDGNAGRTRTCHGATCEPCRAASPSGPDGAHGHPVGRPVAAAGRPQHGGDAATLARQAGPCEWPLAAGRRPRAATRRGSVPRTVRRPWVVAGTGPPARPHRAGRSSSPLRDERRADGPPRQREVHEHAERGGRR